MEAGRALQVFILIAALSVTGCDRPSDTQSGSRSEDLRSTPSEPLLPDDAENNGDEASRSAEASDAPLTGDVADHYAIDFGTPVTWTENGVSLSIDGMTIADARATDFPSNPVPGTPLTTVSPSARTVVILRMTAANHSERSINYFPASGNVEVLGEMVKSRVILSDEIGGRDWPHESTESGRVLWLLDQTDYVDALNARSLVFTQPWVYAAQGGEMLAAEVEIVVRW